MTKRTKLDEFTSADGQSVIPDPIAKDSSRPADRNNGETAIPEFATRVDAINAVVQMMSGLPKEHIANIFKGMTDSLDLSPAKAKATRRIGTAKDDDEEETLDQTRRSPTSAASEELITAIGSELTEDVKLKTKTLFEAAVNSRVAIETVRLEEEFDTLLEEQLAEKVEALSEQIDNYISYAAEQWVAENSVAIEKSLKADIAESFLNGLKNLFAEHYVEVPDDKFDLVAELSDEISRLTDTVNSAISENIELKDRVEQVEINKIFAESVSGMALTQKEKLGVLVEGLEYENATDFATKLSTIKEAYFGTKPSTASSKMLTEATEYEDEVETVSYSNPVMKKYADAIARTSKK